MIYVAPTEPPELRAIGVTSSLPELRGSDLMWSGKKVLVGVQRKATNDLVQSIYNGRINHEFEKMAPLKVKYLLVEGRFNWTRDGEWTGGWTGKQRWTRTQMWAYLASVQERGFRLAFTDDLAGTIEWAQTMYAWSQKEDHSALDRAPVVPKANRLEWVIQVLCPGIGPAMSRRLIEANGGRLPFELTMGEDELKKVPGWGPKRVKQLLSSLETKPVSVDSEG